MEQWLSNTGQWMFAYAAVRAMDLVLKPRPPRWRDVAIALVAAVGFRAAAVIVAG